MFNLAFLQKLLTYWTRFHVPVTCRCIRWKVVGMGMKGKTALPINYFKCFITVVSEHENGREEKYYIV